MERVGIVEMALEFSRGVSANFNKCLEVSLDCGVCERQHRTVIFGEIGGVPVCTPTRHDFPGELLRVRPTKTGSIFEFQYRFEPFNDSKYPDEARYAEFEHGAPTWARASFSVTCSKCGSEKACSIQSNTVRPWVEHCSCGGELFKDNQPPALSWRDA